MADIASNPGGIDAAANNNNTAPPSPGSIAGDNADTKVPKDRSCPFCGQAFTSSSLGRHLDLYIKPKNPKPPDGVHDLAEIRRLRGGITRRQPRASLKAAGGSEDDEASGGGSGGGGSGVRATSGTPRSAGLQSGKRTWEQRWADGGNAAGGAASPELQQGARYANVNAPNWQATGVINNLPPRAPSRSNANTPARESQQGGQAQRVRDMRRDAAGNRMQRPGEYDRDEAWRVQESVENGRAAELALREVLGSLEAARERTQPKVLFESFDFFSMSFGGLCLAILPQPTTLFSSTPFPSPDSCTLQPPGKMQLDVLTRLVWERVLQRRQGLVENRHLFTDSDVFKHQTHVQAAWEHWANMTDAKRHEAWIIECLRSFEMTKQCLNRHKDRLEAAEQRVSHLEKEYDRLSKCQLPRELLVGLPNTIPISDPIVRDLNKTSPTTDTPSFDTETLLNKWRAVVRTTARSTTNPPPNPRASAWNSPIPTHNTPRQPGDDISGSMILSGSIFGVNGAMPRNRGAGDGLDPNNAAERSAYANQQYMHGERYGGIVDYQTPVQPGAIVGGTEDGEDELASPEFGGVREGDVDVDAEGEEEEEGAVEFGARGGGYATPAGNRGRGVPPLGSNANGKRPLAAEVGRGGRAKVLRER